MDKFDEVADDVRAELLDRWWRVRSSQGRADLAQTVQGWLIDRYPASPQAVNIVFSAADSRHDARDIPGALAGYQRAAEMAPAVDRAGLARMRWGQIHFSAGRFGEAAHVFEGYLRDFPDGRRWEEAAYWAAESSRGRR